MPILNGVDSSVKLFDVVAFNATGEREMVVSAGATLSGAVSCARGFNHNGGSLVAVVLPVESDAAVGKPESSQPLANESSEPEDIASDRTVTFSRGELLVLSTKSERVSVLVPAAATFCVIEEGDETAEQYEAKSDSTKGNAYQVASDRTDETDDERFRIICLHPDGTYCLTDGKWTRTQADEWLNTWHHATSVAHAVRDDAGMQLLASNLADYNDPHGQDEDSANLVENVRARRYAFVCSMFRNHLKRMYLASEFVCDSGDIGIVAQSFKTLAKAVDDCQDSESFEDGLAGEWRNDELEAALGIAAEASA